METGQQVNNTIILTYAIVNLNEKLELEFLRGEVEKLRELVGVSLKYVTIFLCLG